MNRKIAYRKYVVYTMIFTILMLALTGCQESTADLVPLTVDRTAPQQPVYFAYDIAELDIANPWHENMKLERLPVFKNKIYIDAEGKSFSGLSFEQMTERVNAVAAYFGQEVEQITQSPSEVEIASQKIEATGFDRLKQPYQVTGRLDDVTVIVNEYGATFVTFAEPVELPAEYQKNSESREDELKTVDYLTTKYRDLFGFESYVAAPTGNYNPAGEYKTIYRAYQSSADISQQMLDFAYKKVTFMLNKNGGLDFLFYLDVDLSEKVGDYPIINIEQAKQQLLEGKYLAALDFAVTDAAQIADVELVYGYSGWELYQMPYYRFYVELSPEYAKDLAEGLKAYGAYYVPAVEARFIENMPESEKRD